MKTGRNRHGRKDHSGQGHALRAPRPTAALGCSGGGAGSRWPLRAGPPRRGPVAPARPTARRGRSRRARCRLSAARCALPAPPGTARASTATAPPAARPCSRARSASPTARFPAAPRSSSPTTATPWSPEVIDRGPYTPGNDFDLTNGARRALDFEGVGAGALRGRRSVRPQPASATQAGSAALMANLPGTGRISNERSMGMSRSSHGAVNAGRLEFEAPRRWSSRWRLPRPARRTRAKAKPAQDDRRPRRHGNHARPLLPRVALPGDRQRHRLPGQHQPGPAALPRAQGRQDHSPGP